MSNTIDKRIVEMGFENEKFESGVQTSIKSLVDLKKGLDLKESAKSLTSLTNAGKSFSLEGISNGVQNISNRFSSMGIVGMGVLLNLTNQAMELARKIGTVVLGLDSMREGFGSYETKVNAIKTVMAGTGESLEEVTANIVALNEYSDRTIYSFEDMTSNISKFTNAGLSSKEAATAIQGISNVAAISGANTNEAARAMYNFGQALSQGSVRLMDWKSIELANMATVEFKNQLLTAGLAMGTLKQAADGTYKTLEGAPVSATKGFNDSLQDQWLTVEVLSKVLGDYASLETDIGKRANAAATEIKTFTQMMAVIKDSLKTGWTTTWELLFGNLVEATELFTFLGNSMGEILNASAKSRNGLLTDWKSLGGRAEVFAAIKNAISGLLRIVDTLKDAFGDIFPPITGEHLLAFSKTLRSLSLNFLLSSENMGELKRAFTGVAALFDVIVMAVTALGRGLLELLDVIIPSGNSIFDFGASIGDNLVNFRNWVKENDVFNKAIAKIGVFLGAAAGKVKIFGGYLQIAIEKIKVFGKNVQDFGKRFAKGFAAFGEMLKKNGIFAGGVTLITGFVDSVIKSFSELKKIDLSGFSGFGERLKARFAPLLDLKNVLAPVFAWLSTKFAEMYAMQKEVAAALKSFFSSIWKSIVNGLESVDFSNFDFNGFFDTLNAGLLSGLLLSINSFVKNGSGVFTGVKDILKSVKGVSDSGKGLLDGVKSVLDGARESLKAWQESLRADMLLKIAGAVAILAISLIALSLVDSAKLAVSLGAITALFADLMATLAVAEKTSGGTGVTNMAKVVGALVAMSLAILLLSGAVALVANIKQEDLIKGLSGITAMTALLVGTSIVLSKYSGGMIKGSVSLIIFTFAIRSLAVAVKELAELDPVALGLGLTAVGVLLAELAIFMKKTDLSGMGILKTIGILILATAVNVLAIAVGKFGTMDIVGMLKGLGVIAIVLTELRLLTNLTSNSGGIVSTAIAVTILGVAMIIFAKALAEMAKMSWEEIARGLAAMAGSLLLITAALLLMPKDMVLTGAGLLIVAASLVILSKALTNMGKMSWEEIAKGLVLLGGSLAIIAVAMYAMTGALPGAAALVVVALALSMLVPVLFLLGSMPLAQIGVALLALAGVFGVLGLAALILGPIVPVLFALAGAMILLGIAALAVGGGVMAFAAGMASLAVSGAAGVAVITLAVTSLATLIPMIATKIALGFLEFARVIGEGAPVIGETVLSVLRSLLETVTTIIPEFVATALTLVTALLTGLASALPDIIQAGMDIIIAILTGVRDNIYQIVTVAIDIVTEFIAAVASKIPDLVQSAFDLMVAFIDGLAVGIEENLPRLQESVIKLGGAIVDGMVSGVESGVSALSGAVIRLANKALDALKQALGINSPSKEFYKLAVGIPEGAALGVDEKGYLLVNSVENLAKSAIDGMSGAIGRISDLMTNEIDAQPVIRPVIDLTDVLKGSKDLNGILADRTLNIAATIARTSDVSSRIGISNDASQAVNGPAVQSTSVSLTQNNYSPKALSRFDIYRQTRNQMITLKGMIGKT